MKDMKVFLRDNNKELTIYITDDNSVSMELTTVIDREGVSNIFKVSKQSKKIYSVMCIDGHFDSLVRQVEIIKKVLENYEL